MAPTATPKAASTHSAIAIPKTLEPRPDRPSLTKPQRVDPAALDSSHHVGDILVSAILIVIVLFVSIMASFFWKKYKKLQYIRLSRAYEYSQLSQCDGVDFSEVPDDLGLSLPSTDEEESASPATLAVTSCYVGTLDSFNKEDNTTAVNSILNNAGPLPLVGPSLLSDSDEEILQ